MTRLIEVAEARRRERAMLALNALVEIVMRAYQEIEAGGRDPEAILEVVTSDVEAVECALLDWASALHATAGGGR